MHLLHFTIVISATVPITIDVYHKSSNSNIIVMLKQEIKKVLYYGPQVLTR